MSAVLGDLDYDKLITTAIEMREDGDFEESAEQFAAILQRRPGDPRASIEYARTLTKLNKPDLADRVLSQAAAIHPDNFELHKSWTLHAAFTADGMKDHQEALRRGKHFRSAFPPSQHPAAWESLVIELDLLYETGLWDELEFSLEEHWDDFIHHPEAFRGGAQFLAKLFLNQKLIRLLDQATSQAWGKLPAESRGNVRARTELAAQVQQLMEDTDSQIIPMGQNCLPYLVGGPWGLFGRRAHTADLTIFDRCNFFRDTAIETIESDFSALTPENFEFVRGFGRCRMPNHKPTGATFFHERASFWLDPADSHFLDALPRRIKNWRRIMRSGQQRIFFFCYCGAGNLDKVVDTASRRLLDERSHLLVVDVLQGPHECPAHPRVTYAHIPYPPDFLWTDISVYSSKRGLKWEVAIMSKIIALLKRPLNPEQTLAFDAAQLDVFQRCLRAARQTQNDESTESLLAALLIRFPGNVDAAMEYARILRSRGRSDESARLLSQLDDAGIHDARIFMMLLEAAAHGARWNDAVEIFEQFATAFPPETDEQALQGLRLALVCLYDSGRTSEAYDLILRYLTLFTASPDLFVTALDILIRMVRNSDAAVILSLASEEALKQFSTETLDNIKSRLGTAQKNASLLPNQAIRLVPLGQNALPHLFAGRWGLLRGPANASAETPFDIGGFWKNSLAQAIESDFSTFLERNRYRAVPSHFGGAVPVHDSGADFFSYRRAIWDEPEWERFLARLDQAVAEWRDLDPNEPKLYVSMITQPTDMATFLQVAEKYLLSHGSKLLIVDMREQGEEVAGSQSVLYAHMPMPQGYDGVRLVGFSSDSSFAYENSLLRLIQSAMLGQHSMH